MDGPSPMGSLSKLPPELRFQLYRLLLSDPFHKVLVFRESGTRDGVKENSHPVIPLDVAVTSKAIKDEALQIFYSANVFKVSVCTNLEAILDQGLLHRPSALAEKFIRNITFAMDIGDYCSDTSYSLSPSRAWVKAVAGSGIARGICHVIYEISGTRTPHPLDNLFFEDLLAMTSFRKVIIDVVGDHVEPSCWGPSRYQFTSPNFVFQKALLDGLESTLGPVSAYQGSPGSCRLEYSPYENFKSLTTENARLPLNGRYIGRSHTMCLAKKGP